MKSSPFASIDLNLIYGDTGALTSTSATVKDQTGPAMLGLFKVASSAAVAFGTGGIFSLDSPTKYSDCFKVSDKPVTAARAVCAIELQAQAAQCQSVERELVRRLRYYVKPDGTDKAPGIATLVWRDDKEKGCLGKVRDELTNHLKTSDTANPDALYKLIETEFDNDNKPVVATPAVSVLGESAADAPPVVTPPAAPPQTKVDVREAILNVVEKAIESGDLDTMKRLAYVSDAAIDESGLARFNKLLGGSATATIDDASRLERVLRADKVKMFPDPDAGDQAGLDRIRTIGEIIAEKKGFETALTLEPAAWRARYIASLQMDITQKAVDLLSATPGTNLQTQSVIVALREKIASLANVRSEFERAQSFRRLLDRMPSSPAGERLSPAIEYEEYRKQVAALEQGINAAIAQALVTDAKSDKPPLLPPQSPWVAEQCVTNSASEKWRHTQGADAPRFVVVLRREDGTALVPKSNGSISCNPLSDSH